MPLDADKFIQQIQEEMTEALKMFHDRLLANSHVSIESSGRIRLKKLEKQTEAINLTYLHDHVKQTWGLVS